MAHKQTEIRTRHIAEMLLQNKKRDEIVEYCLKHWKLKRASADRLIGFAKPILEEKAKKLNAKIEAKHEEVVLEAETEGILTQIQARRELSEIATKKTFVQQRSKIVMGEEGRATLIPQEAITIDLSNERVKAIAELSRLSGWTKDESKFNIHNLTNVTFKIIKTDNAGVDLQSLENGISNE
jgi:hypothetical protein